MLRRYLLLFAFVFSAIFSHAQLLTWTPDFAQDNDNIVITMDASKGNQALYNYSNPNDVYVHVGVITNLSTSPADWRYVPFTWGTTPAAAKATSLGNNKYSYTINNIRTFFGVPAGEVIKYITILFRNGAGSVVQRNSDASDMYVPVYDNTALAVRFSVPPFQPLYIPAPEPINKSTGDNINVTAIANQSSNLTLFLNGTSIQTASAATTISANPVLTTSGNNEIVVQADNGTTVKKDTLRFFVNPGVTIAPLPAGVRDGINYESDNTAVTLVLYAPGKSRVSVIGQMPGSNWAEQSQYLMNKTPDGNYWWLRITGLTPGTEYAFQYLVDGTLKIADPYTEKVLDPYNDGSIPSSTYPSLMPYPTGSTTGVVSIIQTNAPSYNWQVTNFSRPDKHNLIIYELLVRDLLAAHDWNTLRDTLNYFKNLGVNALEIMPFNEFEGNSSWGYNPDFYFAPDKYYGPENTLKQFIDSCHARGIAVIMDIALNHSFGLSPMVQLYWDAANNRPAANNPWFNPVATHPYNVGYDMNHESLATRYFFSRVVENWLVNYKMDGFRFDLAKGFTQNANCGASQTDVTCWGHYDASRIAIWKRYYDTCQAKSPGSYVILEHFADNDEETELSNYGMMLWGNLAYNFQQASMGYATDWNFEWGIFTVRNWTQPNLVTYMESHDEERLMYKNLNYGNVSGSYNIKDLNTGLKRIEMCASFLFNIPGPKMFWEFGELGYDYSINTCQDGTVNNNCRVDPKPIKWDYLQVTQRKRLHDVFASLIKLRFNPLYKNDFTSNRITRNLSGAFKWLEVTTDTSNICVIGNFDVVPQTGTVTFQNAGTWYDYLDGSTITATGSAQNITLQPGEYHVYLNRNVVNAVTTPVSNVTSSANSISAKVYPNPADQTSVIQVSVPENGYISIDMWNSLGQKISNVYTGFLTKGIHVMSIPSAMKKYAKGNYLLRVQAGNKSSSVQFVLQ
jgi:glycosidase